MSALPDPCLSIVVEWENVRLGDMSRCTAMLRQLQVQAAELRSLVAAGDAELVRAVGAGPVEVVVGYDDEKVDPRLVARVLAETVDAAQPGLSVRTFALGGGDYYALKNAGAERARADVVVLVDSDVIPELGWLVELVRPLARPRVQAVVGNTYIEPAGLVGKAFALVWVFPLRGEEAEPTERGPSKVVRAALANNAAFRRPVLQRFPFPPVEGTTRASGIELERTLREQGLDVVYTPRARAGHPHLWDVEHALAEGRDGSFRRARGLVQEPDRGGPVARFAELVRTIVAGRRRVGLSAAGVPAAIAVAGSYYGLVTVGRVLARLRPDLMATRFKL